MNLVPPRQTDAEVVAGWAAEALRDGRYNLGKALASIAQQAQQVEQRARVRNVPWAGQTRTEHPARVFSGALTALNEPTGILAPGASGHLEDASIGLGPTGRGDQDLEDAAIGVQLEQTNVMPAPDLSPSPTRAPDSARCVATVVKDGMAGECWGVAYWAPGRASVDGVHEMAAGWRHVDPAVDEHHTPEVRL